MTTRPRETDLYAPIKNLLTGQGYTVKGEVGAADLVALRGDEPPVIVELKTGFTLSLFHQAVERQRLSDAVYIAAPRGPGAAFSRALKNNLALCRRLGLGLITVRLRDLHVEIHLDPKPYKPRPAIAQRERLLREFARREGDPNIGGSAKGKGRGLITAYRQDALRVARHLSAAGPTKASRVAEATGVAKARNIMADDHYGWFERVEKGIYALTPRGRSEIMAFAPVGKSAPPPPEAAEDAQLADSE